MRQWEEEEEEQQPWVEGFKSGSFLCFATDTHHHQLALAAACAAMFMPLKSIVPPQVQQQQLPLRTNVLLTAPALKSKSSRTAASHLS